MIIFDLSKKKKKKIVHAAKNEKRCDYFKDQIELSGTLF